MDSVLGVCQLCESEMSARSSVFTVRSCNLHTKILGLF